MAIKELFYDNRPQVLLDPRASQRIDPRFKFTRNGPATFIDRDGIIRPYGAATNEPRFSYVPTGEELGGLLLEPGRTNHVKNANGLLGFASIYGDSFTLNAGTAPDGTSTAMLFAGPRVNNSSRLETTSPSLPAGDYVISFFYKKVSGSDYSRPLEVNSWGSAIVASGSGSTIDYANGWKRHEHVVTFPATGSYPMRLYIPITDSTSYLFWGMQFEGGRNASSYIPTTTAAVTRAADLLSIEAPLPASGSVYIDARAITVDQNDTLLSLKNSSNNKIDLGFFSNAATYDSLALISNYNGTSKSSLPLPVPTINRERNVITYGSQNYQYGSNTSRFATSLSSSVPTGLNQLSIGHDAVDPTKAFNGYINSVYLWSGELTPEVAEALVRSDLDPINADTFVPTGPAGSLSIIINTQGASASGDKVFALPAESVANDNDLVITWGDGTESGLENAAAELGAVGLQKTYTAAGIYSIFVEGKLENLQFNNSASAPDLVQIVRWGTTANGNDVFLSPSTMANAFYGCSKMDFSSVAKTTNLPDTSAVANWTNAFRGCSSITGIFPQFNFSGATNFSAAWRDCSSLTAFTAAGGQPQNVTNFSEAWYGCSGLTSFPLIDTSSGINFNFTWFGCSSLTSFPLIDTAAATGMTYAWRNCSALTSFPLINTSACTSFAYTWRDCSSLTSFPLINTGAATNFDNAWRGCLSLTSFPLINTSSAISLSVAWYGCTGLTSFPLIDTSVCNDFSNAWVGCSSLTSFPLIDTGAGVNFARAWYGCTGLTNFPAINTSAATSVYQTWYSNTSLIDFPSLDFDAITGSASDAPTALTGFYGAWLGCTSLATFPANLFDNTTCNRYLDAFSNCALTAASIENIIVSIESAGTSNGNLSLQGGTNAGASTWTANAVTAYNALVARGWTITRNA